MGDGRLLAVSDIHVVYEENRSVVASLRPRSDEDWLIVAGDVAEKFTDVEWALTLLSSRFAKVVWAPGNHARPVTRRGPLRGGPPRLPS